MRIPESFIQEVIFRNPLEEIVSQYATLKRAGSNMVCCCPFHHEKTPSFTLYSSPSHYYCYGCGAGGDVITFVRQMENLDYVAAVEFLANRAGLSMPVSSDPLENRVNKKRFYEMNAEAARFWHKNLFTEAGRVGLDYLTGRGLSLPIIKHFGLGYATDSWDGLCRHLTAKGYRPEEIKEAFLGGVSSKSGKLFDYFRGRAMFPVFDVSGNVVAFSGRQVAPLKEGDRKYFNTNDTPVFKKSRTVFALNFAKNCPEKELILCEGNMDVVSLHAHGVTGAVASLVTSLTADQCRLLSRYTERILLCYDADAAGVAATKKAIRLLREAGLKVRVMTLSGQDEKGNSIKDPDDFIRRFGKGGFDKFRREAPGAIEYLFREILSRHELDSMDGKSAFIRECVELVTQSASSVEKELYVGKISEVTGIPAEIIRLQVTRADGKAVKKEQRLRLEKDLGKAKGLGNRINPDKAKYLSSAAKEEHILGILLLRSEYLTDRTMRPQLESAPFRCEFCRRVLEKMLFLTGDEEPFSFPALNESFTPEEMGELEGMKKKREELGKNSTEILTELLRRLGEEQKKDELKNEPLSSAWLEKLKAEKARKD